MIYFVATPIGNLKDITLRALEVLKSVDVIACEDTRTSKVLLSHYEIAGKTLISYHKFNEQESSEKIIELASAGKDVAIISDAGMPGISDPGNILAKKLSEQNVEFSVIPGANAVLTALVYSGFNSQNFYFVGFMPEKRSDKEKVLNQILTLNCPLIFYVSSHNLKKDISYLNEKLGNRNCCLTKELTKLHENKFYFSLNSFPEIDERGEFVLIVDGAKENQEEMSIFEHVLFYVNLGLSKNDAIKKVANERHLAKNEVYKEVLNLPSTRV